MRHDLGIFPASLLSSWPVQMPLASVTQVTPSWSQAPEGLGVFPLAETHLIRPGVLYGDLLFGQN